MSEYITTIREFIVLINPLWIYLIIFVVGLFVYWRGCTETRKNRSSIFDTFFISIIFGSILGRASYLAINWSEYSDFVWYFLPYEKYGDTVYLFRLLPWRLMRIWDGGLTIFVAMIGFLIMLTLLVLFLRKWRWYQVYFPVFFSMITMLGLSFMYVGVVGDFTGWILRGLGLFVVPLVFWLISKILLFTVKNGIKRRKLLVYIGTIIVTAISLYISYEYLSDEISRFEFIFIIILLLWTAIMDIFLIIDINKPNVKIESVSTIRAVDIEINQPIRIK